METPRKGRSSVCVGAFGLVVRTVMRVPKRCDFQPLGKLTDYPSQAA